MKDPSNDFQNRFHFQVYIQGLLDVFLCVFFLHTIIFLFFFLLFFKIGYYTSQVHLKFTIVLWITLNFYAFNFLHLIPIPLPTNPGITGVWPHTDFMLSVAKPYSVKEDIQPPNFHTFQNDKDSFLGIWIWIWILNN